MQFANCGSEIRINMPVSTWDQYQSELSKERTEKESAICALNEERAITTMLKHKMIDLTVFAAQTSIEADKLNQENERLKKESNCNQPSVDPLSREYYESQIKKLNEVIKTNECRLEYLSKNIKEKNYEMELVQRKHNRNYQIIKRAKELGHFAEIYGFIVKPVDK